MAEVLLALGLVVLAEMALRRYVDRPDATLYPTLFASPLTMGKYLAYRGSSFEPEPLDVLMMGMSQMMRLSAERLAERISTSAAPRTAFNFAAPLHTVEYNRRLLKDVLISMNKPRLLVYGIIPMNVLWATTLERVDVLVKRSFVFSAHDGTPAGELRSVLLRSSHLMLYRGAIRLRLLGGKNLQASSSWRAMRATSSRSVFTCKPCGRSMRLGAITVTAIFSSRAHQAI